MARGREGRSGPRSGAASRWRWVSEAILCPCPSARGLRTRAWVWAWGFGVVGVWTCRTGPSRRERGSELRQQQGSSAFALRVECRVKLKAGEACTGPLRGASWLLSFHKDSVSRLWPSSSGGALLPPPPSSLALPSGVGTLGGQRPLTPRTFFLCKIPSVRPSL